MSGDPGADADGSEGSSAPPHRRSATIASSGGFWHLQASTGNLEDVASTDVVELLRQAVRTPPRSTLEAQELEARLWREHGELPELEDFREALALYQPTDSPDPHLIGYKGIRSAASMALHDLNDHSHCLHDVPLMDRP